jgi:hypothetical protein
VSDSHRDDVIRQNLIEPWSAPRGKHTTGVAFVHIVPEVWRPSGGQGTKKAIRRDTPPEANEKLFEIITSSLESSSSRTWAGKTRIYRAPVELSLGEACLEPNKNLGARRLAFRRAHLSDSAAVADVLLQGFRVVDAQDIGWRTCLIEGAEVTPWEPSKRERILAALHLEVTSFARKRPSGYERPLAIALRTIALISESSGAVVALVLDLLRPADSPATKLAALAALRILYSTGPECDSQPMLWSRLSELLDAYANVELVSTPQLSALLLSAFVGAVGANHPDLAVYADRVARLPRITRNQIAYQVQQLMRSWPSVCPGLDKAMEPLQVER